jgi:probable HAF family extracellular repeat protein
MKAKLGLTAIVALACAGGGSAAYGRVEGFLYYNGVYTPIDVPGSDASYGTFAFGINNSGQIVGQFGATSGYYGFLYSNGVYTTLNAPESDATYGTSAGGINNSGQIIGAYSDTSDTTHGFSLCQWRVHGAQCAWVGLYNSH